MGLADVITKVVAVAHRVTGGPRGVQVRVTHRRIVTASDGGTASVTETTPTAIVEDQARRFAGERVSKSLVTFLTDVAVGLDDQIVLPGGDTGPILAVERLRSPLAGAGGYLTQVWLGETGTAGGSAGG